MFSNYYPLKILLIVTEKITVRIFYKCLVRFVLKIFMKSLPMFEAICGRQTLSAEVYFHSFPFFNHKFIGIFILSGWIPPFTHCILMRLRSSVRGILPPQCLEHQSAGCPSALTQVAARCRRAVLHPASMKTRCGCHRSGQQ